MMEVILYNCDPNLFHNNNHHQYNCNNNNNINNNNNVQYLEEEEIQTLSTPLIISPSLSQDNNKQKQINKKKNHISDKLSITPPTYRTKPKNIYIQIKFKNNQLPFTNSSFRNDSYWFIMKPTMPYKRNTSYRSGSTVGTFPSSPLFSSIPSNKGPSSTINTYLPTKPTPVISLFNELDETYRSKQNEIINNNPSRNLNNNSNISKFTSSSCEDKNNINLHDRDGYNALFRHHHQQHLQSQPTVSQKIEYTPLAQTQQKSAMAAQSLFISAPTKIFNSINSSFKSITSYFTKNELYYYDVCFDTDDLYNHGNENKLLKSFTMPKNNITGGRQIYGGMKPQQQQSHSPQIMHHQAIPTSTTTTTTLLTTTTTTSYLSSVPSPNNLNTTSSSSTLVNNINQRYDEMKPSSLLTQLSTQQPNSLNFSKNGAVNLPSPCFKRKEMSSPPITIGTSEMDEKSIFGHTPPSIVNTNSGVSENQSSKIYTVFNNICTFILQDANISPQEKYKAKLCIGFCFTVFSFIPSWIIFFWLSGLKEPAIMAFLSLPMSVTSLWVLRKTGSTHFPGHMLCFTLCFALAVNSYYTGGHQSTIRLLMSTIPIISALVCGRRASVQWSMVVLFVLLLFFLANLLGYEYVDGIPTITIRSHMNFIIDVTLVLITMAFTLCYQYFIDEAHRETKLKNEQLTVAKDAAIEAYQARQEFLATMSHEIRTPLNGLIGMATLLRDSLSLPPEEKQMAKSVKSCGDILLRLVNDILDLSKLEANQMVVENIPFKVRELTNEICHVLAGQAKERGLQLLFEVSDKVPNVVFGDTGRILQVLMNLTGNALKFTPEGNVKIVVDIIEDDKEKITFRDGEHNICFRVKDTGIGVPPESHQKIFEAFVQADPSDSRKYGGSGLGLYLCAKLVKLMRGEIGVYNNECGGSTFWFILPLQSGCESAFEQHQQLSSLAPMQFHNNITNGGNSSEHLMSCELSSPSSNSQSASSASSPTLLLSSPIQPSPIPIKVLVAEDNVINQRVAVKFLEKIGIKASVASNGNEVLAILENEPFDLIFMDFQMPILDGLRCCKTIRDYENQGKWAHRTPIYICGLTANTMTTDKKRCFDSGMNHFISKPFQMEQLRVAIALSVEFKQQQIHQPLI